MIGKRLLCGIVDTGPNLHALLEHDDSGLVWKSGESENVEIDRADLDLGARLPDEIAAENIGMQGSNEDADAPQRQARRDQPLADFRHHLRRAGRGPRAVDQPVGEFLQFGCVHDGAYIVAQVQRASS